MYFRAMPNIYYDSKGDGKYKLVKNLLRRVAVRTKVKANTAVFDTYDVKEGESPESIAHKLYGDVEYHWIVLLMNDVTDRYHDWPMTTPQFLSFMADKYSNPSGIHHYEISQTSGDTTKKINVGTVNTDYPAATAVTNLEYEEAEQDKKRKIKLLDPSYLDLFSKEYTKLMSESVF